MPRIRAPQVKPNDGASALTAIRVFNDPQVNFKAQAVIVLMMIAWTYLLHAHFRVTEIEHRYDMQYSKRRVFNRMRHGGYKYCEPERRLNESCALSWVVSTTAATGEPLGGIDYDGGLSVDQQNVSLNMRTDGDDDSIDFSGAVGGNAISGTYNEDGSYTGSPAPSL